MNVSTASSSPLMTPTSSRGRARFGNWVILSPARGRLVVVYLVQRFAPEAKCHSVPEVMDAVY
jgi:chloride channel protein, CIC family